MSISRPIASDWAHLAELYRRNHPDSPTTFERPTSESSRVFIADDGGFPRKIILGFVHVSYIESSSGRHGVLHEVEINQGADPITTGDAELDRFLATCTRGSLVSASLNWLTYHCDCATADVSSLGDEGPTVIESVGLEFHAPGVVRLVKEPLLPIQPIRAAAWPPPVPVARQVFR